MKLFVTFAICLGVLYQISLSEAACSATCPAECYNGGVRGATACDCSCPPGFTGPQCQYSSNPCAARDPSSCSSVNCYTATNADFFRCQAKCLCCKNKLCYNGGIVKGADCGCKCFSNKYSEASDCKTVTDCTDDARCGQQFGVFGTTRGNCQYDFVKYMCPKTCQLC